MSKRDVNGGFGMSAFPSHRVEMDNCSVIYDSNLSLFDPKPDANAVSS